MKKYLEIGPYCKGILNKKSNVKIFISEQMYRGIIKTDLLNIPVIIMLNDTGDIHKKLQFDVFGLREITIINL